VKRKWLSARPSSSTCTRRNVFTADLRSSLLEKVRK
jgi:hypothetical protein